MKIRRLHLTSVLSDNIRVGRSREFKSNNYYTKNKSTKFINFDWKSIILRSGFATEIFHNYTFRSYVITFDVAVKLFLHHQHWISNTNTPGRIVGGMAGIRCIVEWSESIWQHISSCSYHCRHQQLSLPVSVVVAADWVHCPALLCAQRSALLQLFLPRFPPPHQLFP